MSSEAARRQGAEDDARRSQEMERRRYSKRQRTKERLFGKAPRVGCGLTYICNSTEYAVGDAAARCSSLLTLYHVVGLYNCHGVYRVLLKFLENEPFTLRPQPADGCC